MKWLWETCSVDCFGPGCCAYRGINQTGFVHVRNIRVAEAGGSGTNGVVDLASNGGRVTTDRVLVIAENVYVSVAGGSAASNTMSGELTVPLVKLGVPKE